ncbi:hypothetical protein JCM10207_002523 [Rhodosporidiobolus poonsookiae]
MRPLSLGAALCTLYYAHSTLAAWDCSPLQLDGVSYDLSSLAGIHEWETEHATPPTITKTRYALSLCSPLPDPSSSSPEDDCPSGTRLCQRTYSSRSGLDDRLLSVVPVAGDFEGSDLAPAASKLDGAEKEDAWVLEIGGGTWNGQTQKARIEMRCDREAKETKPTVKSSSDGVLTLEWRAAAACPSSSSGGGGDAPPADEPEKGKEGEQDGKEGEKDGGGMGFFGWFFTLLFLSLALYFALGIYSNHQQYGATGWDAVPHREVLQDLPYVVADLVRGRGRGREGYAALG